MIIKAKEKDLEEIKETADNKLKSKHSLDYFKKYLNKDFYIYKDKEIKGFIIIDNNNLILIVVKEQGEGIGTKLLNFVKKRFSYLKLRVRESNESAINFYLKNGFKEIDKLKSYYKNGETAIIMEYQLK